jgi:hypothetical protein
MTSQSDTSEPFFAAELVWDHFGPDATATAEHFLRHLKDFLAANLGGGTWTCSTLAEDDFHCAVRCRIADADQASAVAQRLRAGPRSTFSAFTPVAGKCDAQSEKNRSHP